MVSILKRKGTKNSFGGYPTEFADSTQNPKKIYPSTHRKKSVLVSSSRKKTRDTH
jgi:hypothetical protein